VLSVIEEIKRNNIRVRFSSKTKYFVRWDKRIFALCSLSFNNDSRTRKAGGQEYLESSNSKIAEFKAYLEENNLDLDIEVDGGINDKTASQAVKAGADILVAGSYILNAEDTKEAIQTLKNA
jgi:hypothetical protein